MGDLRGGLDTTPDTITYYIIERPTRIVGITTGPVDTTDFNFARVSWIVEYSRPVRNLKQRTLGNTTDGNFQIFDPADRGSEPTRNPLIETERGIVNQGGREYATHWKISTELRYFRHEDFIINMFIQNPAHRSVEDRIFDINERLIDLPDNTRYTIPVAIAPRVSSITRQGPLAKTAPANHTTTFGEVVAAEDIEWQILFSEPIENFTADDVELFVQGGHNINGTFTVTPDQHNPTRVFEVRFSDYQESLAILSTADPTNVDPYIVSLRVKEDNDIVDLNDIALGTNTTPILSNPTFRVYPIIQIESIRRVIQGIPTPVPADDDSGFILWDVTYNRDVEILNGSQNVYTTVLSPIAPDRPLITYSARDKNRQSTRQHAAALEANVLS